MKSQYKVIFNPASKSASLNIELSKALTKEIKNKHKHPYEFALNTLSACIEAAISSFFFQCESMLKKESQTPEIFKQNAKIVCDCVKDSVDYVLEQYINEIDKNEK